MDLAPLPLKLRAHPFPYFIDIAFGGRTITLNSEMNPCSSKAIMPIPST